MFFEIPSYISSVSAFDENGDDTLEFRNGLILRIVQVKFPVMDTKMSCKALRAKSY